MSPLFADMLLVLLAAGFGLGTNIILDFAESVGWCMCESRRRKADDDEAAPKASRRGRRKGSSP